MQRARCAGDPATTGTGDEDGLQRWRREAGRLGKVTNWTSGAPRGVRRDHRERVGVAFSDGRGPSVSRRTLPPDGAIEINRVAPGFVATRMHKVPLAAGPDVVGSACVARTRGQIETGGFPASEAAELVVLRDPLRSDPDLAKLRGIDEQFYARAQ